jgi:hypothetical protein
MNDLWNRLQIFEMFDHGYTLEQIRRLQKAQTREARDFRIAVEMKLIMAEIDAAKRQRKARR